MAIVLNRRQALIRILYGIAVGVAPSVAFGSFPTKSRTGILSFCNEVTGERLSDVRYVRNSGRFDEVALRELNHFFRCTYDGEVRDIDPGLFYWLDIVKTRMGRPDARYRLYSGYRSPEYNGMLRRKGYRAAKNSFHLQGRAADVRLEGVPLDELEREAASLQFGGVSRYRNYVHIDVGPNRTW